MAEADWIRLIGLIPIVWVVAACSYRIGFRNGIAEGVTQGFEIGRDAASGERKEEGDGE